MKISKFAYTGAELLNYDRVPMANQIMLTNPYSYRRYLKVSTEGVLYAYDLNESCLE